MPVPNEASNAMNRLFGWFTMNSSGLQVGRRCVTCNASRWQDITQLCLRTPQLMSAHSACITPTLITHASITIIRPLFISSHSCFLHIVSNKPTHTHCCFLLLQEHIFQLMKSDSYARFLRSNIYQDLLLARKKVSCTH